MFAVKQELLKALLKNPEWYNRLEKAETPHEVEQVFLEFALAKGFKIKEVSM